MKTNKSKEVFFRLLRLALSDVSLTLKLVHPRRIKNAIRFLFFDSGNLLQLYRRYENIYVPQENICHEEILSGLKKSKTNKNIFIFPIIDWDFRYQRPQHIATHLAKLGYRVFYFSTVPSVTTGTRGFEFTGRPANNVFLCKLQAGSGLNDDLHRDEMKVSTRDEYLSSTFVMMSDLAIIQPIIILQHFYWAPLSRVLPKSALVYDCMDHHVAFFEETQTGIPSREALLIRESNSVVTSSVYLHEKIGAIRENTLIRNGCESAAFLSVPERRSANQKPVAGYIGAIAEWFDTELFIKVAKLLPSWRFILVGASAGCDTRAIKTLPNVELVGEVEYSLLPIYLEQFDVCIIPFKLTELTKATNPVKVYEYLCAGRPVVSTPLPELLLLDELVLIADNPINFASQLAKAFVMSKDKKITCSLKIWAQDQDWTVRALQFEKLITKSMVATRDLGNNSSI